MCAQQFPEQPVSRIAAALSWLGGGPWRELGERHERSSHAIAGVVVTIGAVLAWIVVSLVVGQSASWPATAVVALALVVGLLVGTVARAAASGPIRGWPGIVGRGLVAVTVGVIIGELAALIVFSSSIDRRLEERVARNAASAPAVAQALAALDQARTARTAADTAVDQARQHRNDALVVARCEYHPLPECPQTRITGVPGSGPETRTANELLTDAQLELDSAVAARERLKPELDAEVARDEQALAQARQTVITNSDHSLGARWVAMHDLTLHDTGPLMLRLIALAFFALLYLLPLILRRWHRETTQDRHADAQVRRERAELEADTAIAIKRAEVRQAAEIMWAEQQLANARLAVEAQTAIDRAYHRRQVAEALAETAAVTGPVQTSWQSSWRRTVEPADQDMYLPIAAEAEAASWAAGQLPAAEPQVSADQPVNLPAPVESTGEVEPHQERATGLNGPISDVADVTKAAARWIRPLVPPFVARAIDSTVQPLRAARQAFEEVEEITFLLRRTHKVTIDSENQQEPQPLASAVAEEPIETTRIHSARVHHELPSPDGPRQLSSGE